MTVNYKHLRQVAHNAMESNIIGMPYQDATRPSIIIEMIDEIQQLRNEVIDLKLLKIKGVKVSLDDGKTWKFMDTTTTTAEVEEECGCNCCHRCQS